MVAAEPATLLITCAASRPDLVVVAPAVATFYAPAKQALNVTVTAAGAFQRTQLPDARFDVVLYCNASVAAAAGERVRRLSSVPDATAQAAVTLTFLTTRWPFVGRALAWSSLLPPINASSVLDIVVARDGGSVTLFDESAYVGVNAVWVSGAAPPFDATTRVAVGDAACATFPAADGRSVRFVLPTLRAACGAAGGGDVNGSDTCGGRTHFPLSVTNAYATVSCPPFCPGARAPLPLPVPYAASSGLVMTAAAVDTARGGGGVTFVAANCTALGFTDPTSGACTNASDPAAARCAFVDASAACVPCPLGAICPGGSRAWPRSGFWTPAEDSGALLPCTAPAAARCLGWDEELGATVCGPAYDAASYACDACAAGFYVDDAGACAPCPPAVPPWDAVSRGVLFAIGVAAFAAAWIAAALAVRRAAGRPAALGDAVTHFAWLALWCALLLQYVVQVAAPLGEPEPLATLLSGLRLFRVDRLSAPPACLADGGNPLRLQLVQLSVVVALCGFYACALVAYAFRRKGPVCAARARRPDAAAAAPTATQASAAPHHPSPRDGSLPPPPSRCRALLGVAVLALSVILIGLVSPYASIVFGAVTCDDATISVRNYLQLWQSGGALARAGIAPPAPVLRSANFTAAAAAAAALSRLVTVQLLRADPSIVCWDAHAHAAVGGLAWAVLLLFVVGFPLGTALLTRAALRRRKGQAAPPLRTARRIGEQHEAAPGDGDAAIARLLQTYELWHVYPFAGTAFRGSLWWLWQLDLGALVVLPALALLQDAATVPATLTNLAARFALQLALTAALAAAYVALRPFAPPAAWWMLPAKLLSLALAAVLAALGLVLGVAGFIESRPGVIAGSESPDAAAAAIGVTRPVLDGATTGLQGVALCLAAALLLAILAVFLAHLTPADGDAPSDHRAASPTASAARQRAVAFYYNPWAGARHRRGLRGGGPGAPLPQGWTAGRPPASPSPRAGADLAARAGRYSPRSPSRARNARSPRTPQTPDAAANFSVVNPLWSIPREHSDRSKTAFAPLPPSTASAYGSQVMTVGGGDAGDVTGVVADVVTHFQVATGAANSMRAIGAPPVVGGGTAGRAAAWTRSPSPTRTRTSLAVVATPSASYGTASAGRSRPRPPPGLTPIQT